MAEDTPVTYEDLPDELKKKHDEIKATLEAELIGSFHRTRSHGVRWKGFTPEGALDGGTCPPRRRTHQVKYEDLPEELKRKHDEIKATLEAELIGSSEKTRPHDIKLDRDSSPSPGVNMVDLSHSIGQPKFSFGVNMAGLASRHGKDEAESSHARGKDEEEADPRDRPQDDDRRYLTGEGMRSVRYRRPLSKHLLNKYEQQYDRRRHYDVDDERNCRFDAEVRRYHQHDRSNDGYSRQTEGRSRGQDYMDRHWDCPFFKHCWDSGMSRLPTIEDCPECKQRKKDAANVSVFSRLGPLPPRNKHAESARVEDLEELEDDDEEDKYHRPGGALMGSAVPEAKGSASAWVGRS
ncbi:hypothetical protein QYE76_014298 [Lolium multiflorum]|uniref:Uncharacterized protein n=1 Tax=Lolium multiflorum TaxID=4521 RepID=A0AAD8U291_LOLMU|nr:hypothetical protein QYE76_014298 [Lolium multiflorum]